MATVLSKEETHSDSVSRLCRSCGLCCDGTLFRRVPLEPSELDVDERLGLEVFREGGAGSLRQPCSALEGRTCRVYAERPSACRKYECLLVAALRAGEVDLGEAQALVAEVRAEQDASRRERTLGRYFLGRQG